MIDKQQRFTMRLLGSASLLISVVVIAHWSQAQPAQEKGGFDNKAFGKKGPMMENRKLVKQFDRDSDGRLDSEERQAARAFLKREGPGGGFRPGGGPGGFGPGMFLAKPLLESLDRDGDGA